ncbi:hypothetical protein [Arthrobacter sp. HLT1-21]
MATHDDGRVTITTTDGDATVRALVLENLDVRSLEVHTASLEEAFRALTGNQQGARTISQEQS